MMSEKEVRSALAGWHAATVMTKQFPDTYTDYDRGLAEGYRSALEMVLRGKE